MNVKTIVENIFRMEEELGLFDKQVGGVYFWELIRFSVFMQITQKAGLYGQAYPVFEKDPAHNRNYISNAAKNIFVKNPFFTPACDILFLGHTRRMKRGDGLWWDLYCDPVIDYLKDTYKCVLLELPYFNTHQKYSKTKHIRHLDLALFIGFLSGKLRLAGFSLSSHEEGVLQKIQQHIQDRFNVSIDIPKFVSGTLYSRSCMLPVYTFLLRKIRPKVVIVVCSYGKEVFITACRDMGVPVVELQHGTISKYHVGYSFPAGGKKTFPDYFLTFGDYWRSLASFPIPEENIMSVGFPFFEMQAARHGREQKDQVIFISQGTIGKRMSAFAVELQARKGFPLNIVYKLHPGEYERWRRDYPWLIDSGITVIDDNSVPLYKLLAESRFLVGVYSTSVYEGLGLGLRAFLLDLPGVESMEALIDAKAVSVVPTVDAFLAQINQPVMGKIPAESFFKPNALENISEAIEDFMRREYG